MIYVGLSGYAYRPWQGEGRFYPPELKQKEYLNFYSARYGTVEVDGTWYKMPSSAQIENYGTTPEGFRCSFKAHRNITHIARLKPAGIEHIKYQLVCQSQLAVTGRLGPMLVQLPPNLKVDLDRLKEFFEAAPKLYSDLPRFEREDSVKEVPAGLMGTPNDPIYYNVEFRHETWHNDETYALLESLGVGYVCADTDEAEAKRVVLGTVGYARLRKSEYSGDDLASWAKTFLEWNSQGKDVYVYLKHEDDGSPWIWADELLQLLK